MNSLTETLNGWGGRFLEFAWPMLWQSSLLIALMIALDRVLRKKVRAAIRYSLWLVVLVKLILPPSLALPTSLAWWLRPSAPAPEPPRVTSMVFTRANLTIMAPRPMIAAPPALLALPTPKRAPMSPAAWALVGWSGVSLGLLGWLTLRWRRVTKSVQRTASTPSPAGGIALAELLEEAKRLTGVRRFIRVRLTEHSISPAVYGLFWPVILLPRPLVERIAGEQLRAVLMHELIHFRRGDVWVNCAQSLLQITYWWHPLVWLANARIRRVREEAVDDAVMIALRHDAEHYAPALLEVAKLALSRPLSALGLVGILESRTALQQRIERLMNFTTPRRAGLSIVWLLGIAAFSALAVPMGEAPPKSTVSAEQASLDSTTEAQVQEASANDSFELKSDAVTYYSRGGVTQARGNVTLSYCGTTITADSAFINQEASLLVASGHVVVRRGNGTLSSDHIRYNFKTDELHTGDFSENESNTPPAITIRIASEGTYWSGSNSVDLAQLRTLFLATGEQARKSGQKGTVLIEAADTARFETVVRLFDLCKETGLEAVSLRTSAGETSNYDQAVRYFDAAYKKYFQHGLEEMQRAREAAMLSSTAANSNPAPAVVSTIGSARENPISTSTNLIRTSDGRQRLLRKLDSLRITQFSADNTPLSEVIRRLREATRTVDPEQEGVYFLIDPTAETPQIVTDTSIDSIKIKFDRMDNVRLADLLDAIVTTASKPIKYSIRDYAVVFSRKSDQPELHLRSYKVDPNTIYQNLQSFGAFPAAGGPGSEEQRAVTVPRISAGNGNTRNWDSSDASGLKFVTTTNSTDPVLGALNNFFLAIGVDLRPSTGKNIFYKDRQGLLMVHATARDLEVIEAALQTLNTTAPQINIKVKFVELGPAEGSVAELDDFFGKPTPQGFMTNGVTGNTNEPARFALAGILTDPQYRVVLHALEQKPGASVLNEGQVTTLSGRQAQIQVCDLRPVVTNSYTLATTLVPTGPTLDVVPYLEADGSKIELTLIPKLVELIDYADPGPYVVAMTGTNATGAPLQVIRPQPAARFRVHQVPLSATVWDGQTVMLAGLESDSLARFKNKVPVLGDLPLVGRLFRSETNAPVKKRLLIFVTPTLVDPAGNRMHPEAK